jgi:hypothetical protein
VMFLYSGYADGLEDGDATAAGIRACLAKPVDAAALFQQLEAVLGPP